MNFPARIIHPDHGAMHAYNPAELESLKARGWRVETPAEPVQAAPVEVVVERKKPGPKPKAA